MVDKINVQNVATLYQISSLFYLLKTNKVTFDYIQRCFPMVAECDNFFMLDFNHVNKILSSSELNVSSEIEVFNAADSWLNCKDSDRSKFATRLLSKVRFPALSKQVLKNIVKVRARDRSYFLRNKPIFIKINEVLKNKKQKIYKNKSSSYFTHRYCNSNLFDLLLCGGSNEETREIDTNIYQTKVSSLKKFNACTQLTKVTEKPKTVSKAVYLKGEIYIFCSLPEREHFILKKYSPVTKSWEILEDSYHYQAINGYAVCSFVNSIILMGGWDKNLEKYISSTVELMDKKWKEVSKMREIRCDAASAVFQGRIVVTGGYDSNTEKKTGEAYDCVADEWSNFPNMTVVRYAHSLLSVNNKLYAIGGQMKILLNEVFDPVCGKFVALKSYDWKQKHTFIPRAVAFGRKILVFRLNLKQVVSYDVDDNEWSQELCEMKNSIYSFECVKLPQL